MGETTWYVLRVISGQEEKIRRALEHERKYAPWGHHLLQVFVPKEKIYTQRQGKKIRKERNIMPGYMFIEVDELTPEMIADINRLPNVISFLTDAAGNPQPLDKEEINRLLGKAHELEESPEKLELTFYKGESVKIIDGPFQDFVGTIDEIIEDKKKLRVIVPIFGRNTPVEVDFTQVEKIS